MAISDDLLHKFIFDNTDIRGEIVTLETSLTQQLSQHNYPEAVQRLLGEFMAAAALLSSTLKFEGLLTLQARGDGSLPLIMAEADHDRKLRAIAKIQGDISNSANLPMLVGSGMLSITIDPDRGKRYQGIVPLDAPTLSDCLEHYFDQSEQLPTRLWLKSNGKTASGLLLQQLPRQVTDAESNQLAWENRVQLANTLTDEELLNLDHPQLLTRLFHEEGVRYFEPVALRFHCSCSKQRSAQALAHLGKADAMELAREQGVIEVGCEFCGHQYLYSEEDVVQLFSAVTKH